MGDMTCCVIEADRSIHARCEASIMDQLIPALSDDPETIEEMQHAMRRFQPADERRLPFDGWSAGECDQPPEGGICLVDLAARLIVYQSESQPLLRDGAVTHDDFPPDSSSQARWIPFRIADQWRVVEPQVGWRAVAGQRRRERQADPAFDTRAILYDEVIPFLVERCLAARGGSVDGRGVWTAPSGWQWRELSHRVARGQAAGVEDAVAEIHAQWLMTPRDDLLGQTPREVLHAQRSHIDQQVEDRESQWSCFGERPLPLWRKSRAYRWGGYGTQEIVVYYDLLRHLIHACWKMVVDCPAGKDVPPREAIVENLAAGKQEWLHTPQEEFSGRAPRRVIECERLRLPNDVSGDEAMIDCDCPLCQMMVESGPLFWHLDTYHMDDDFPFALHATREQWECEQGGWTETEASREDNQEEGSVAGVRAERRPMGIGLLGGRPGGRRTSVWGRSDTNANGADSPGLTLFGLGGHVAELIVDLKDAGADREWIDVLNRDFGNLRQATADASSSLVDPVVGSSREHLFSLAEARPELADKCQDLARQLREFAGHISGETTGEVPF